MCIENVSELINPGEQIISLTGGGGKTSLMYLLAQELSEAGKRVISTSTTRIAPPRISQTGGLYLETRQKVSKGIRRRLDKTGHITVAHRYLPGLGKLEGITMESAQKLPQIAAAAHVIIEADGAKKKPLKAPADHEPVIPEKTDVCIAVMGLDALGKSLEKQWVFRPELISKLTGIELGSPVTAQCMATLATAPTGLFKGCPDSARRIVFLNKADLPHAEKGAYEIIAAAKQMEGILPSLWCIASIHHGRYTLVYSD